MLYFSFYFSNLSAISWLPENNGWGQSEPIYWTDRWQGLWSIKWNFDEIIGKWFRIIVMLKGEMFDLHTIFLLSDISIYFIHNSLKHVSKAGGVSDQFNISVQTVLIHYFLAVKIVCKSNISPLSITMIRNHLPIISSKFHFMLQSPFQHWLYKRTYVKRPVYFRNFGRKIKNRRP
jgi:hypothetical protein